MRSAHSTASRSTWPPGSRSCPARTRRGSRAGTPRFERGCAASGAGGEPGRRSRRRSRSAIGPGTVTAAGRSRSVCCSTTAGRSRSARTWPARWPVVRPTSSSAATSPTRSWTERPTRRAGSGSTARPLRPRSASARPRSPRSPAGRRRRRSRSTCNARRPRAGPMRPPPRRGCGWTTSGASVSAWIGRAPGDPCAARRSAWSWLVRRSTRPAPDTRRSSTRP